jgi:hypothetical protein
MKTAAVLLLCLAIPTLVSGCVANNAVDKMEKRMQDQARLRALEPTYAATYDVSLLEVQRSSDAQARFGDIKTSHVGSGKGRLFHAEDELLHIMWTGPDVQLGFDLLNKSDSSMKVVWDEAAYVDIGGQTHRVIHNGVKLAERNSPQPPSVIPSKGRLNDMVYPSDNVSYSSSRYSGGWSQVPMFPCMPGMVCQDHFRKLAVAHSGMHYRVLLSIEVGKENYPYTFVFMVNKAEVVTINKSGDEATK